MDINQITKRRCIGLLLVVAAVYGCSGGPHLEWTENRPIVGEAVIRDLDQDIESLYLDWHSLDQVYKDIKFIERGLLFDVDDRQLGYVQKAALYVQDAAVRIHNRWEQLAVMHFVRPEMRRDYITLNVNGLTSTINAIGYDLMFLDIYTPFIENDGVRQDFKRARDQIQVSTSALETLRRKLLPFSNEIAAPLRL